MLFLRARQSLNRQNVTHSAVADPSVATMIVSGRSQTDAVVTYSGYQGYNGRDVLDTYIDRTAFDDHGRPRKVLVRRQVLAEGSVVRHLDGPPHKHERVRNCRERCQAVVPGHDELGPNALQLLETLQRRELQVVLHNEIASDVDHPEAREARQARRVCAKQGTGMSVTLPPPPVIGFPTLHDELLRHLKRE